MLTTGIATGTQPGESAQPGPFRFAAPDSAAFRAAFAHLAAGVSVITTVDNDGQKIGLTATAVTAVSAEPPLVLVCIGHWSRAIAPLQANAPFIIHLLAAEQQQLARHFATAQVDKFAGLTYEEGFGGCPRLSAALAWIECIPHRLYPAGDHLIVVGQVLKIMLGSDTHAPLVYFRRQFHTLSEPTRAAGNAQE